MTLADQVALMGNCVVVLADVMWECDERHKRAVGWIEEGG
jgi:hypothetical protein